MNKLNVGSIEEKILFFAELQGQASDGKYENSKPANHWCYWCDLDWNDVGIDSENIGVHPDAKVEVFSTRHSARGLRSFRYNAYLTNAPKRSYSITDKEMLEIIGERMLAYIIIYTHAMKEGSTKITHLLESDWHICPESIADFTWIKNKAKQGDKYYKTKLATMTKAGLTEGFINSAFQNTKFTYKDLRKVGSNLKAAMKSNQKYA